MKGIKKIKDPKNITGGSGIVNSVGGGADNPAFLTMDGASEYISTVLNPAGAESQISISFWVKTTATTVLYLLNNASTNGIWISTSGGAPLFQGMATCGGTGVEVKSTVKINDGDWHHVVFVLDGDPNYAGLVYIDGVEVTSATINTAYPEGVTGAWDLPASAASKLPCSIDEFAVYYGLLSQANVTALYGSGTPETGGDPTAIANLELYHKFDGDTIPNIIDSSGNSRTSTASGMDQTNIVDH